MEVSWETLLEEIKGCSRCPLCEKRTFTVPGEGNPKADIMLVGEGPGQREDETGRPFVGAAGQLLDRMLAAISLSRNDVYIGNIVKCRPPGNRAPTPQEAMACMPFLRKQYALVRPKLLVCLGATPAKYLIGDQVRVTRDHGTFYEKKGLWITLTYHPAALLRDELKKRDAWRDLQAISQKLKTLCPQEDA